jgi:hypothetical protein
MSNSHFERIKEKALERYKKDSNRNSRSSNVAGKSRGTKKQYTNKIRPISPDKIPEHALVYREKGRSKTISFENVINLSEEELKQMFKLEGRKEFTEKEYGYDFLETIRSIKDDFISRIKDLYKPKPSDYKYNFYETKILDVIPIEGSDNVTLQISILQTKPEQKVIINYLDVPKDTTEIFFDRYPKDVPSFSGGKLKKRKGKIKRKNKTKKNKTKRRRY